MGSVLRANELIKRPAGHEHRQHESDTSENQNQRFEWFEFRCHYGRRQKALAGVPRRSACFALLLCPPHHSRFPDWLGWLFGNHLRGAGLAAFKLPSLTRSPRQPCSNITVRVSIRHVGVADGVVTVARQVQPLSAHGILPFPKRNSRSGPDETRTRYLRRAKASQRFAGRFSSVQNTCKSGGFCVSTFPGISGDLLRLLHGCCTQGTRGRTRICGRYFRKPPSQRA